MILAPLPHRLKIHKFPSQVKMFALYLNQSVRWWKAGFACEFACLKRKSKRKRKNVTSVGIFKNLNAFTQSSFEFAECVCSDMVGQRNREHFALSDWQV